ncbi:MAG: 4-hydroxythreonine-4-phosphate dehydrogenase PdxA [Candidatus Melainabacteria bacterium]|nr:4-hydroxythreonine-4-phosphate dehydrogenase PdxA [Candidatus Melainabacteria bacterium]
MSANTPAPSHSATPVYYLTVGDPLGIGPEIALKLLQAPALWQHWLPAPARLVVVGHRQTLELTAQQYQLAWPVAHPRLTWLWVEGCPTTQPGLIAYHSTVQAVSQMAELQQQGIATGLVTGPVSKTHFQAAGLNYPGQTELLESLAQQFWPTAQPYRADMLFLYQQFRMLLLTRHIPLSAVSARLNASSVYAALQQLVFFLQNTLHIPYPRLGLLGVNPHAGEVGGHEESQILVPAFQQLCQRHQLAYTPPMPADAAFRGFRPEKPCFDAYVAAYHDQGLIPVKLIAGFSAVNVTTGLPFIRTAVSHGMAQDIVGHGIATPDSLIAALQSLQQLVQAPTKVTPCSSAIQRI